MWVERLAIKREWGCRRVVWQVLESAMSGHADAARNTTFLV